MQCDTVFEFFTIGLRFTLTFRVCQESQMVSTLGSPSNALQWIEELRRMGHSQVKQPSDDAHACDELAGDLFCCKYRLHSSHMKSHASHSNGRLPLCASLCLARKLLWIQQYSHSVTLEWAFAAVARSRFESLTFEKQVKVIKLRKSGEIWHICLEKRTGAGRFRIPKVAQF